MTAQELLMEFDLLYNNISSNQAPGLTDYEKSVFLTKAKEELLLSIYKGSGNLGLSFEMTEESRRYLDSFIREITPDIENLDNIKLEEDLWFITYEEAEVQSNKGCFKGKVTVIPVTQDDYYKIMRNPFRSPNYKRILRLDIAENTVKLIHSDDITIYSYIVKYIVKPKPVILEDGYPINGETGPFEDDIHDNHLWRLILDTAVQLAIQSYSPRVNPK